MKTWEMIKALTENPKLKFTRVSDGRDFKTNATKISDGGIVDYYVSEIAGGGSECIALKDDWEQIREPVDFMTAVKAFREGRTAKCKTVGIGTRIYKPDLNNALFDQYKDPITINEIIEGKWFIE